MGDQGDTIDPTTGALVVGPPGVLIVLLIVATLAMLIQTVRHGRAHRYAAALVAAGQSTLWFTVLAGVNHRMFLFWISLALAVVAIVGGKLASRQGKLGAKLKRAREAWQDDASEAQDSNS